MPCYNLKTLHYIVEPNATITCEKILKNPFQPLAVQHLKDTRITVTGREIHREAQIKDKLKIILSVFICSCEGLLFMGGDPFCNFSETDNFTLSSGQPCPVVELLFLT